MAVDLLRFIVWNLLCISFVSNDFFFFVAELNQHGFTPHESHGIIIYILFSLGNKPSKYQYWSISVALAWLLLL